ncbi:MAG TPA: hypothetical protein VGG64_23055 [Pirellulales bacterium]
MTGMNHDPLQDPQLAEAWNAFAQLIAASDSPLDEAGLAQRVVAHAVRRSRRRRLQMGAGLLTLAAGLVVCVSFVTRVPRGEPDLAAADASRESRIDKVTIPTETEVQELATRDFGESIAKENAGENLAWDDELAVDAASLANDVQAVEQRWQEQPDSIALLQTQVDKLEREITDGTL